MACAPQQLLVGRGSDEAIDLLVRVFCRAGQDNVIHCPPTFGMYAVAARIQGAALRAVPLQAAAGFALDVEGILAAVDDNTKLVFVCSPNNPTANARARGAAGAAGCARSTAARCWWWMRPTSSSRLCRACVRAWMRCRTSPSCAPCPRRMAWPARAAAR
ncbi:MAG: aminotransferase class I/II-fold pyridoxal phosphate-dependent enzyme [Steroidobacteraceae bacterium]